jgi:hypothetical protein
VGRGRDAGTPEFMPKEFRISGRLAAWDLRGGPPGPPPPPRLWPALPASSHGRQVLGPAPNATAIPGSSKTWSCSQVCPRKIGRALPRTASTSPIWDPEGQYRPARWCARSLRGGGGGGWVTLSLATISVKLGWPSYNPFSQPFKCKFNRDPPCSEP